MYLKTRIEKIRYFRKWTLLNAITLIIAYPVGLIIGLAFFTNPGYEWGNHFEQSRDVILFHSVAGIILGTVQWLLLRKKFKISSLWILTYPLAVIIFEVIAGIICHKMDINRGDLSFLEGDPFGHALLLAISGFLIGLLQILLLKKAFVKTGYWALASSLAWSFSVLITALGHQYDFILLITFVLGTLIYGSLTGATLIWILKHKSMSSN